jgi:quercetin dioxygenase-like cupin family protein
MSHQIEDATRVIESADQDWIPIPNVPGANIKVIVADEELNQVVFKFRFEPGTTLPSHTHKCHAIAYTISGEWEYEGLKLPEGAIAYEPVESVHTPSSEPGAELVVFLNSKDDQFLINHMPDGTDVPMDMAFFKTLQGISLEDAAKLEIPGLTS